MLTKTCPVCKEVFETIYAHQIYNKKRCANLANRQRQKLNGKHYESSIHDGNWGFEREADYILHLGTNHWSGAAMSRRELLLSYINTIHLRTAPWWHKVYNYACKLYQEEFGERGMQRG
jgi:hypothetical protein